MATDRVQRRLAALLSADVKDYSRLIASDAIGVAGRLGSIRERLETLLPDFEGRLVDFTGDNFLGDFSSAVAAVRCALAIQSFLEDENRSLPPEQRIDFRMGLHMGDIVSVGPRVFGEAVNIAARLESMAAPGGICISGAISDLVRNRLDLETESLGEQKFKNIDLPVRAYRIQPLPRAVKGPEPASARNRPPVPAVSLQGTLVDRADELSRIEGLIDRTLNGMGGLALISGEPGIGKTRLAEEALWRAAERGAVTAIGRGSAHEGAPAFWSWAQVLRTLAKRPALARIAESYREAEPNLSFLLPPSAGLARSPLPGPEAEGMQFQLFDALSSLLEAFSAEGPLVLLLDDLQWGDPSSLQLLEFIAPRLGEVPVAIVATYRSSEADWMQDFSGALLTLARSPSTLRLQLRGVSERGAAALVGSVLSSPSAAVVHQIHQRAQGNPLFILEIAHHLDPTDPTAAAASSDAIPDTIRELIEDRMRRFPDPLRETLQIASVLGQRFRLGDLGALTEMDPESVAAHLVPALKAGDLQVEASRTPTYRFHHALTRDALYGTMDLSRRKRIHERAANVIEQGHADDIDSWASEIFHHLRKSLPSCDADRVVRYGRIAGRVALSRYAYAQAAQYFHAALECLESNGADTNARCELLLSMADALYRVGTREATFDYFARAGDLARQSGNAHALARAALGISGFGALTADEDATRTRDRLEEALAAIGDSPHPLRVRLLSRLASLPQRSWLEAERAESRSREAIAVAAGLGDDQAMAFALEGRHLALNHAPQAVEERVRCGEELIRLGQRLEQPERRLAGHYLLVEDHLQLGDVSAVQDHMRAHDALVDRIQQPFHQWRSLRMRAMWMIMTGDFDGAERTSNEAYRVGQPIADADSLSTYGVQLFYLRWLQGRLHEIREPIAALADRRPDRPAALAGLALLDCSSGREAAGREVFERFSAGGFERLATDVEWTTALSALAQIAVVLRDAERAEQLYELLLPYADLNLTLGTTCYFGAGAYHLAVLSAAAGELGRAAAHFETAVRMHEAVGALPMLCRTLFDYASVGDQLEAAHSDHSTWTPRSSQIRARAEELAASLGVVSQGTVSGPSGPRTKEQR